MDRRAFVRRLLLGSSFVAITGPAVAHHGWRWTADGVFELSGLIREIYLGNPHAYLEVDVAGEIWRVELAPPFRTRQSGFVEGVAAAGDDVVAWGSRSADPGERRMKAVRIATGGTSYDVYPRRTDGLAG